MADADDHDKTEEPTEKRIRDAVEKGQVPVSREAALFASFAAALVACSFAMRDGALRLAGALSHFIDDPAGWSLDNGGDAILLFQTVAEAAARFVLPILLLLMVAGIIAAVAQNPPRLAADRIMPDPKRVSLLKGASRLFGPPGLTEFAKNVFKFGAVSLIVFLLLRSQLLTVIDTMFGDAMSIPDKALALVVQLLSALTIATLVLFSADLVWTRVHWRRDLRMSRQEIKDEMKQSEGDPLVKARLRSLALDRSRQKMLAAVPRATLVIANPTHYAIALRYKREEGGAPIVIAKGQDFIALKIREIAEAADVPVVEDKLLARSLYDKVTVDKMIPPEFYRAVAELIHFLGTHKRAGIFKR